MDRTLISFNLPNIITVTLMAALGYALLAGLAQVFQNRAATAAPSSVGGF